VATKLLKFMVFLYSIQRRKWCDNMFQLINLAQENSNF